MHENRNLFLFFIEINNMHRTRHILPIPRTCIWRRCGRCGVSWHRVVHDMPVCATLKITPTFRTCRRSVVVITSRTLYSRDYPLSSTFPPQIISRILPVSTPACHTSALPLFTNTLGTSFPVANRLSPSSAKSGLFRYGWLPPTVTRS